MLEDARARVQELRLKRNIRFEGFVADRSAILNFLRGVDVFLFTHITPESPRCLIEALISGLPLIGYQSSYVRDLVSHGGGGEFTRLGDTDALAQTLVRLYRNREALSQLTEAAANARGVYNDEAVFAHRSELIKKFS